MNNRTLAFAGAGVLAAGLFTPIVTMPIVDSIHLFTMAGNVVAIALLLLAGLSAFLAAKDRLREVFWTGLGAAVTVGYLFARLQYRLSEMRESIAKNLADNPFAGLAQTAMGTVQVQWGWLVLALGVGLLIYVGITSRRSEEEHTSDGMTHAAVGLSVIAALLTPGMDVYQNVLAPEAKVAGNGTAASSDLNHLAEVDVETGDVEASKEEAAYIKQHLRLYDLDAKYFESLLGGRVPGVRFKIKNNGNRTLNQVTVRVVFYDANGGAIAEEEYHPVIVSQYSSIGDNTPLRPNYIWQQDPDSFSTAKGVPSEWQTGKATATITDIEFGPNE